MASSPAAKASKEKSVDGHLATHEVLDEWTARGLDPSLGNCEVVCYRADVVNEKGDSVALCCVHVRDTDPEAKAALYFQAQAVENARCGVSWWDVTSDVEKRSVWVHYCTSYGDDDSTRRALEVKDDRQTIASLRRCIEQQVDRDARYGMPRAAGAARRLRLRCHGADLDDGDTVRSAGLDEGDVIDVVPENAVHRMVSSSWFERLILLAISANAVTMIVTAQNPQDAGWQNVETAFTLVFIAELVLKWVGCGIERYFRDRWNLLDFIIVVEGTVSLLFLTGAEYDVGLSALRVVRTLRPLRAALRLPELQVIVRSLLGALPKIANTLEVCALFMLVFSIAGVQWFNGEYRNQCQYRLSATPDAEWAPDPAITQLCGYRACVAKEGHESQCGKASTNPNSDMTSFDNVGLAALTLFQSITLEGWVEIMNFGQDAVHDATWPFFAVVVLFGNFVLVNLLMGVIITEYDTMHDQSEIALNERQELAKEAKALWLMMVQSKPNDQANQEAGHINALEDQDQVKWGRKLIDWMDQGMCVVILFNVICLCVDRHDPVLGPQDFSSVYVNDIVTCIFVVEMIVKVPSMAYLAHCDRFSTEISVLGYRVTTYKSSWSAMAYFAEPLNLIDAGVVTLGIIEFVAAQDLGATAVFRGVRVVRLVKLSTHIKSMQEVCATISKAGSSIMYVALLLSMFIFIFAVAGMQIFAGKLNDENGVPPRNNFDTFHWAVVSTFQVLAGENWPALMYYGTRASFPLSVIFYLAWLLVGQFVTANLFTAVVFSHFEDLDRFGCPADWRSNPALKDQIQDWWKSASPSQKPSSVLDDTDETSLGSLFGKTSSSPGAEDIVVQAASTSGVAVGADCIPFLEPKYKDYINLVKMRLALNGPKQPPGNDDPDSVKISRKEFFEFFGENELVEQGDTRHVKIYQRNAELLERMDEISQSIHKRTAWFDQWRLGESGESKSCGLFPRTGCFDIRKNCVRIVNNKHFERFILTVILLSTIALILTGPKTDPQLQNILDVIDKMVLFVFIVEAFIKTIAQGLIVGAGAYLHNSWNVLDFTAVVVSVLGLFLDNTSVYGRVMRILRVFRALRLVSHAKGMQVILVALTRSMGKVFDVAVIVCFAFLLFALLGVSLFKGGFYSCNDPNFPPGAHRDGSTVGAAGPCSDDVLFVNWDMPGDPYTSELSLLGRTVYRYDSESAEWQNEPVTADMLTDDQRQVLESASLLGGPIGSLRVEPRQWSTPPLNFDNVGEALLALVVFASGEGWPDAMFNACDMAGLDRQPKRDESPAHAYYFIANAAVFGFFLMDLFVGAIYATFLMLQKESEEAGTGVEILLTDAQREWKDAQKPLQPKHMRPPRLLPKPDGNNPPVTWLIHRLVTIDPRIEDAAWRVPTQPRFYGTQFEIAIQFIIMLNTLVMAATWYGEPQAWADTRQTLNTIFSITFLLEVIMKITGFGVQEYFQDSWNCFDFILTIGSLLDALFVSYVNVAVFRSLRTFRVARLLRLMHGRAGVLTLLNTLWLSIPALLNVAALLALLFTFYAVLGVSVFGELPRGDALVDHNNFETWGTAMITLIRISTGEDWQNLMYACYPCWVGSGFAVVYFVSFVFFAMFILLNMFVMIICDNMDEMDNSGHYDEDNEQLRSQFEKLWVEYHVVQAGDGNDPSVAVDDHRCLVLSGAGSDAGGRSRGLRSFLNDLFALGGMTYSELQEQRKGLGKDDPALEEQYLDHYWYQTRSGGKVSVCSSQLQKLEKDGIIDGFTIIAKRRANTCNDHQDQEDLDDSQEQGQFGQYTIRLGAEQQKLREYLKVTTTDANTEHQIAVALQLHVVPVDEDSQARAGGFVVMFSDLLAALSCLLTEEKLTRKLVAERPTKPNWTAEDWLAYELGDAVEEGTVHKKAMSMQLQCAEQMRQKVGRGIVSQTRSHRDRVSRQLYKATCLRPNVTVEWDPETRTGGNGHSSAGLAGAP